MEKFELLDKRGGSELKESRKISAPWTIPIYKLNMASVVWNISFGRLGLTAWLCSLPAVVHLLIS